MGKVIKNRNIKVKVVNNHKTKIYHKLFVKSHIMSKEWAQVFRELAPMYEELDQEFQTIDLVDLIYYERWLNE